MSSLLLDLLNLIFQMLIKEHSNLSICKLIVESDSTANRYLKVDFQLVMRNNWKRISRVWLQYSIENEKIFRKKFLKFRRKKNFLRRRRNQNGNEFKLLSKFILKIQPKFKKWRKIGLILLILMLEELIKSLQLEQPLQNIKTQFWQLNSAESINILTTRIECSLTGMERRLHLSSAF